MIQKHSKFKHFYIYHRLIQSRSVSPTILPSNVHKHLVITAELRPGSALFHGEIIEGEAFLGRSSGP